MDFKIIANGEPSEVVGKVDLKDELVERWMKDPNSYSMDIVHWFDGSKYELVYFTVDAVPAKPKLPKDPTIGDVFKTFTKEQLEAAYYIIGKALETRQ